jgi:hypothetical protein
MVELLREAKNDFAGNDSDAEDPNVAVMKAQAGDIFKALEAMIKTAAAAEASGANPSATAPKTGNAGSVGSTPIHRRR